MDTWKNFHVGLQDKVHPRIKFYAKYLRHNQTQAESILWKCVRQKQLGVRIRRQKIIRGFIVDFYCPAAKLVIEIDGSQHSCNHAYDEWRTSILNGLLIKVIRFKNSEILKNLSSVLYKIQIAIEEMRKCHWMAEFRDLQ